jgi:hypothetical protein
MVGMTRYRNPHAKLVRDPQFVEQILAWAEVRAVLSHFDRA